MPDEDNGDGKRFAGYSDFKKITAKIHDDVNRAVDAYAHIDSKHQQGIGVTPQTALKTREAILKVTKRLSFEVQANRNVEEIDEIYQRWEGDDGYVQRLENADFRQGRPEWLGDLVDDIIEVSWRLGYLKAGVEKPADPTDDEQQVKEMFES